MIRWRSLDEVTPGFGPSVVSIGNFDGVHRGHRVVIARARQRADDLERDLPVDAAGDPAAVAQSEARLRGLEGFLRGLPDEQRACWVLRELHDLSYAEIAYATNLPVSTVRGRLARARQNLTEGMSAWR